MSGAAYMDQRAIVQAYRHLYQQGLKVVNYSTPSRHVLLRTLRSSFRSSSHNDFDPQRIANTLRFLQRAADITGLEHKIVKNLMIVRYWEQPQGRKDLRLYVTCRENEVTLQSVSSNLVKTERAGD